MSYQFSSNKVPTTLSPPTPTMQFYNPTKQVGQTISQVSSLNPSITNSVSSNPTQKSTKIFNYKPSTLTQIKGSNTSSSTFIKSYNQMSTGINNSNKLITGSSIMNRTINVPTNNANNFSNLNKSLNSEMIKSSIQDANHNKEFKEEHVHPSKFKTFQTPQRRQPRMSQPLNQDPRQQPIKNQINDSPAFLKQRQKQKQKQKQSGFHKFKQFSSIPTLTNSQSSTLPTSPLNPFSPFKGVSSFDKKQASSLSKSNGKLSSKQSINDFLKIKQLGAGKYGKVFLARQKKSGFVCAVKMIQKQLLLKEQIVEQFIRELKIQMFLQHSHIVKMYGFFDDQTNIYILLEAAMGGQLYHQIRKGQAMSEQKVAGFMRQICEAVNEIHSLRIIHRDIKPQNIVLHQNVIKLCDFGWSVHQDNKMRQTFCGTPLYVCPEILRGKQYDEKIDIWSLGIMMFEMLVGDIPFKITKQEELIKIVKDKIQIPSYVFASLEVRDFLDKCLQKNPLERGGIRELLNHDFFKKYPDKNQKKLNI